MAKELSSFSRSFLILKTLSQVKFISITTVVFSPILSNFYLTSGKQPKYLLLLVWASGVFCYRSLCENRFSGLGYHQGRAFWSGLVKDKFHHSARC
jgi:hypothetical protein